LVQFILRDLWEMVEDLYTIPYHIPYYGVWYGIVLYDGVAASLLVLVSVYQVSRYKYDTSVTEDFGTNSWPHLKDTRLVLGLGLAGSKADALDIILFKSFRSKRGSMK
jgi:hypothetical protein